MILLCFASLLAFSFTAPVFGAPDSHSSQPTVNLDGATFRGLTTGALSRFLGIPFAQSPTGDLRFRLPVPVKYTNNTYDASDFGPACPQEPTSLPLPISLPTETVNFIANTTTFQTVPSGSEDCLTINIVAPASTIPSGTKLPVVVWIHGGFGTGGASLYDGGDIVERSIDTAGPIIYVSMNYRMSFFGFLASQEVKDAGVGNLGLQDQREALRWVQQYIEEFGGDPTRVTLWGESMGAISVSLQMLANEGDTEGLFSSAFIQSGSPIPVGDITHGQPYYDALVEVVGCASESDTLACLRSIDYADLHNALNSSPGIFSYHSLAYSWLPRADGVFLKDTPQRLTDNGDVAQIPIVIGDCDDEGTIFSLSNLNITTEAELHGYIKNIYVPDATEDEVSGLLNVYPSDLTQGSPYGTSFLNALTPQYKRLASLQGDLFFQAPRRYFIHQLSGKQNIWVYLSKRSKTLPFLGSAHGTDMTNIYGDGELRDYLISFVNNLDPNYPSGFEWPLWTKDSPVLLTFQDGLPPLALTDDTYREDPMKYMTGLMLKYPL